MPVGDKILKEFQKRAYQFSEIKKVILIGSYAKGTATSESDCDLLIIVGKETRELDDLIDEWATDLSLKYEICVSPIIESEGEWKKHLDMKTLFAQEVISSGIE